MQVDGRLVLVLYGLVLGIAVGIVLESSGALAGLDRAIGRRLAPVGAAAPGANAAPEEEGKRAENGPA